MKLSQSVLAICQTLHQSFLHLAYPSKCLHCSTRLPPTSLVLCAACASLLELIEPDERCPTCFNPLSEEPSLVCHNCLHYPSVYFRMAATFNYEGPAATLVKRLKYANQPYLARGMAAFLLAQFDRLQWPLPDALVPVPLSFMRWLERGYNQSALLAEAIGQLLQRPVWHALKRRSGDYSQAALNLEQRKMLAGNRFQLHPKYPIEGKILLVIDDVLTSGSTLKCCGEILNVARPASLYALTFCRTLHL